MPGKSPRKSPKKPTSSPVGKNSSSKAAPVGTTAKRGSGKIANQSSTKTVKKSAKAATPRTKAASRMTKTSPALAEGTPAPDFTLARDDGSTVRLADYAGRKLVVFFYPRADTPGCTRESIDFSRLAKDFAGADTSVLGISADEVKAQAKFRDKHELTVPLGSDTDHSVIEAYSAWGEKSMYGKSFMGILRTTVLVGRTGKVERIWRNVKVDGHADEVLAAARALP